MILGASESLAQTVQEIAERAFGSTVLLVMEDANGQSLSLGSGFVVRAGEVVTNLHVVEGAARGYAKLIGQEMKYNIDSVTAVDAERDLVILKVLATGGPVLAIGNSDSVQVGETIYAVGNPHGLEGTFSQGIVSSVRQIGTDKLLQITAPISPGSSGGPVLNSRGEVIGVSVATFNGGQNLNFAIPSSYLLTLLETPRTETPLEQATAVYAQSSILTDTGGRSTEGLVGTSFTYGGLGLDGISYSYSLANKMRVPVRNVSGLIVFYDMQDSPIDVQAIVYNNIIPAGLAKRITGGNVHQSVRYLNTGDSLTSIPKGRIEIRILNFEIHEESTAGPGEYIVRSGDTGAKIARKAGVNVRDLQIANPGLEWTRLYVGQVIKLPPSQ